MLCAKPDGKVNARQLETGHRPGHCHGRRKGGPLSAWRKLKLTKICYICLHRKVGDDEPPEKIHTLLLCTCSYFFTATPFLLFFSAALFVLFYCCCCFRSLATVHFVCRCLCGFSSSFSALSIYFLEFFPKIFRGKFWAQWTRIEGGTWVWNAGRKWFLKRSIMEF